MQCRTFLPMQGRTGTFLPKICRGILGSGIAAWILASWVLSIPPNGLVPWEGPCSWCRGWWRPKAVCKVWLIIVHEKKGYSWKVCNQAAGHACFCLLHYPVWLLRAVKGLWLFNWSVKRDHAFPVRVLLRASAWSCWPGTTDMVAWLPGSFTGCMVRFHRKEYQIH